MSTTLQRLGMDKHQALQLISDIEAVSEALSNAVLENPASPEPLPTPAERTLAISTFQTVGTQLRYAAAQLQKN